MMEQLPQVFLADHALYLETGIFKILLIKFFIQTSFRYEINFSTSWKYN